VQTNAIEKEAMMRTEIHLTRSYPHPRSRVWRAITEPALLAKWLMQPDGFAPTVGTRFKLIAKPQPGWRGWVDCEVLEVVVERKLVLSWVGDESAANRPMTVTFSLEDDEHGGTSFTLDHIGFEGVGGWLLARLMMGPGWKKMMSVRLSAVLSTSDDPVGSRAFGGRPAASAFGVERND
jgi:uncharacterized protein YndB with AHSA1/START domain